MATLEKEKYKVYARSFQWGSPDWEMVGVTYATSKAQAINNMKYRTGNTRSSSAYWDAVPVRKELR